MAEAESIEGRISLALRDIERKDAERRRRKSTLQGTLSRLEDRYNARHAELADVRDRVHALGDANREIEALIIRLGDLVEHSATEAAEASAALTLQLRTEMLSVADRFEDVSQAELDAEDAAQLDGSGTPESARIAHNARH